MEKAIIIRRIDLKQTLMGIPRGEQRFIPIEGFTVNTLRSTVARINATEGERFSVSEDYHNRRVVVSRD